MNNRTQIASLVSLAGGWFLPLPSYPPLSAHSRTLAALTDCSAPLSHANSSDDPRTPDKLRIGSLIPAGADRFDEVLAMTRGEDLARTTSLRSGQQDSEQLVEIIRVQTPQKSAQQALLDLIDQGVHALILGNFSPSVSVQLLESTKNTRTPLLHSMVDTRLRDFVGPSAEFGHIFQMCSDETVYIRAFTAFFEKHVTSVPASRRITLVLRKDESPTLQEAFNRLLNASPPCELQILEYEDTAVDWASLALEIQQFVPDAVYFGIYLESSLASIVEYLRRSGVKGSFYCVWVPGIPGFVDRYPGIAEGLVWTTLVGNSGNYWGTRFRQAFEAEFGSDPGIGGAAVHFDMVSLLKRAWSEAEHSTHADDLISSLERVQFQGVTGSFHFEGGRRKALCYPFDTDDPTIGQPCLTFVIANGRSRPVDV